MTTLVNKAGSGLQRIAYCHGSENRYFMLDMLRVLKQDAGAEIHVYCGIAEQASFYQEALAAGEIDSVTIVDSLLDVRDVPTGAQEDIIAQARAYENLLGTTYNRLIMGQRTFGRAFSLGGYYHPRAAYSEAATYVQVLDAINRTIAKWVEEFDKHQFTLVIGATLILGYIAERRKVPARSYIMAGQHNWFYWTTNRYDESAELDHIMKAMPDLAPVEIKGTYGSNLAIMAKIQSENRLYRCFYKAALETVRRVYWRLRGYQKARTYTIRETIAFYFRRRRQMLELRRLATTRLPELTGRPFVFFPLHEEPETTLTIGAPERLNQLGAIAAVARDLPAGVLLAVKETYFGIGRRPSEFYRQIADFKNVVLLDFTEPGLEVGRRANAVVTIKGTVGQEAGILGRPVIYLARHTSYHAIPHARYSDIDFGLKDALAWALDKNFSHERARIDGARYYHSMRAVSVDMRDFNFLRHDCYDADLPAAAAATLARSLGFVDPTVQASIEKRAAAS
jgi:hypothetical protein